jgi:SAM-dependent MidA family methyltransferase
MTRLRLPAPDQAALDHSRRVVRRIREEISRAGGRLSFDRYMDLALNAPGIGYYRAPLREFGAAGDFITAPELSSLFTQCVARQVAEILALTGGGEIFEAGAGSGRLCAQLLTALARMNQLPPRYLILEPGAGLRERQRRTVEAEAPELCRRVTWVDDLPEIGFEGVMVANEMLDALPASRFRVTGAGVHEAFVEWCDGRFEWVFDIPQDEDLASAVSGIEAALGEPLPRHYTSELGAQRAAWIKSAAARFERGGVLIFDYGYALREYYHPQRVNGTLKCFYRHRSHDDPFLYPGLQDISVHVEFSALAKAASEAGLEVSGFTTQAEFLLATGLLDLCRDVDPRTEAFHVLTRQIKRLTLPGEMGELVKVMALTRDIRQRLHGFSGRDLRDRLA